MLQSKHPEGSVPDTPTVSTDPIKLPSDFNIMAILWTFPKLTAAGPSGMHVQHLLDAATILVPASISSSLHHLVNLLATAKAPSQLSMYLAGGNLTALSKNKSNNTPDVHPIAVGEVLRRLISKCISSLIKDMANDFFQPLQFGLACSTGVEKIIHKLRHCIDNNWSMDDFVELKIDISNAFKLVSRQTMLDECAQHFPELLVLSCWCYSQHPILWHQMGTLSSQQGVQQGDPHGPFLFALVLQHVVNTITSDIACAGLFFSCLVS